MFIAKEKLKYDLFLTGIDLNKININKLCKYLNSLPYEYQDKIYLSMLELCAPKEIKMPTFSEFKKYTRVREGYNIKNG
jgi:hypothetical protein